MSKNYHNHGQEDSSKGRYDPPHDLADSLITWFPSDTKEHAKENRSYDKGWNHTNDQRESSSSGCFLTTACVDHAGLADDCRELQVLRRFRDDYVAALPDGQNILDEYYQIAPSIVRRIQLSQQRENILAALFGTVTEAVILIENGHYKQALDTYAAAFRSLKAQFGAD